MSLPHLEVLAERGPDIPGARRRFASLLEKTEDLARVQAAWDRYIEVAPDDPHPHERMADLHIKAGDAAAALDHLRWLTDHAPDREKAFRRMAQAQKDFGDVDGEIATWRAMLAMQPEHGAARERLAALLESAGRKREAAEELRALAALTPELPKPWKRCAKAFEEAGDAHAAIEAWERVLAADPEDHHPHEEAARILLSLGRPAEAAARLKLLAERDAGNMRRWRRLASCLRQAGDVEGEAEAWRGALAVDASDHEANERLARLLEAKGEFIAAADHVRVLAEQEDWHPRSWRRLARLFEQGADADGAIVAWSLVVSMDPADLNARERLAQLLLERGRPAEAAMHLEALAADDPAKAKGWRRLALARQAAEHVDGEIDAWERVLAAEETDLQAHERLAQLLASTGRDEEAVEHLQAVVRLAPESARAWRRLARAMRKADPAIGVFDVWRRILSLAGQGELEGQLRRAEAATQRLETEVSAHKATQALWREEAAERRRLTGELQESNQRRRQAEAEEQRHLLAGRLVGLIEPLAAAEPLPGGLAEANAFTDEALRAAAASGAVIAGREGDARLSAVEVTPVEALPAKARGRRVVVLADADPAIREAARAALAGKRGVSFLELPELLIRRAAGVEDLRAAIAPVSDDVWPARPVMILCPDDQLRETVVDAARKATDLAFAPHFPAALAARVQARELDLDDWLAAAWSAHGNPRYFGFQFDPESLALFAREIRAGGAQVMAKVFRRAVALELVWSDKALFAAADHFARTGQAGADFDAGDAQIEIKTYKRLIQRDMLFQNALEQLGKFRPATVKAYRELFDKAALGRFCRDANLALAVAGFAEVDERALGFMPSPELVRAGELVEEAVASLTATREPETPPAGLVHFGLGRSLEALGRHAEALEAYQEAVLRAPTYFPARAAAARYLELAGRAGEAERLLRQGLGNGTPDPDVQEGLLDFYQRNSSPLGVAAASRLIGRRGQSRPAVAAPALIELGRYREAEPLLTALASRIAEQDTFLNDLVELPDLAGRLEALRAAAQAEGADAVARLALAEALRRLGRLSESLPWYRQALAEPGALEAALGGAGTVRPHFLMVGPPRTGTTLLRRLFELHPEIATPPGELFYFSSRTGERAGSNRQRAPLRWYLEAFAAAAEKKPGAKVIGEKTPHYFSTSDEQMAFASVLLPGVKIVATLRDPVVRAWSEIKVQRRVTETEIVAALGEDRRPNWLAEIIDAGRYVVHLKRWLKHVTADRVLLVDADALEASAAEEAARICRWLGVRELPRKQVETLQRGWDNRTETFAPSAAVEELLRRSYEGEVWTAGDVGRAVGLPEIAAASGKPSPTRRAGAN